jgi:hypothetical protein
LTSPIADCHELLRRNLPISFGIVIAYRRYCGAHKEIRRSRREFATTLTDDNAIAAAAMIGESRMPKNG